jgi:hypothetical protein
MIATTRRSVLLLCAVLLTAAPDPSPLPRQDLTGLEGLVRAYDSILAGRFDQIDAELRRACGPAPTEACDVLAATSLWWQILLDPESRALDALFMTTVDRAIRTTDAWTRRAPDDPEAWFYLGGAYAARVQFRVLRTERLAAARDGKRIKDALERAIALDPDLDDAHFAVGMYKYYADVAPAAAKFLRFLLLLPGGNRREGLAQMLRARDRGRLLQGEADYQLHMVYLWYERDTDEALRRLHVLHQRYSSNPLFLAQIAEIQETYQHDTTASLGTWRALLGLTRGRRANTDGIGEVQARLGIARQLDAIYQTDQAIEQLNAVIALRPDAPYSSLSLAYLRLGEAHDRLGNRAAAVEAYHAAQAAAPAADRLNVRTEARDRLRRAPDSARSEAYRLSLDGWRRLERNDLPGAGLALERSLELNDDDPVARYRFGRVLEARKDDPAALEQIELAIRSAAVCPPSVLGSAYLEAARLHERAGRRDQAIAYYRVASTLFGAAVETHTAAARALNRLRAK